MAQTRDRSFTFLLLGRPLELAVQPGLPGSRGVEPGRRLLVEAIEIHPGEHVLELACGYGLAGIAAALLAPEAHVTLLDDDVAAVACTRENVRRNRLANATVELSSGYTDLPAGTYDVVLLHAPAYRGNAFVRHLIAVAHTALRPGGRFYLAGGMREGLPTFRREVERLFGAVEEASRSAGYRVLLACKGANTATSPPDLETATFSVAFGGTTFTFVSRPGVFSHGEVDPASRLLLEVASVHPGDRILDLGCGYGILGIVAAQQAPEGYAVMVDRNLLAVELARENARLNAVTNVEVLLSDGVEAVADRRFDLVLCNPPFHAGRPADRLAGEVLLVQGASVLAPGGRFYVVANEFLPYERVLRDALGEVEEVARRDGFKVLLGRAKGAARTLPRRIRKRP